MARAKDQRNGQLEEAMTTLLQNQASLVQNQVSFLARMSEIEQRFARIEAILLEHSRILGEHTKILGEHTRILQALSETIRERIGFKIPERPDPLNEQSGARTNHRFPSPPHSSSSRTMRLSVSQASLAPPVRATAAQSTATIAG